MIETCLWELPWQKALKGDREKTNKALKGNGRQPLAETVMLSPRCKLQSRG